MKKKKRTVGFTLSLTLCRESRIKSRRALAPSAQQPDGQICKPTSNGTNLGFQPFVPISSLSSATFTRRLLLASRKTILLFVFPISNGGCKFRNIAKTPHFRQGAKQMMGALHHSEQETLTGWLSDMCEHMYSPSAQIQVLYDCAGLRP